MSVLSTGVPVMYGAPGKRITARELIPLSDVETMAQSGEVERHVVLPDETHELANERLGAWP